MADNVTLTIDGAKVTVPKGTLIVDVPDLPRPAQEGRD
jgi:hypothetical protein